MELFVRLIGRKNLSEGIYRQVRRAIADGRLRPGDRLPPSRELARSLEVSRMTVTVAYDRLLGEGFVTSRTGAGTFISEQSASLRDSHRRIRASGGKLEPRSIWSSTPLPNALDVPMEFDFRTGLPDASLFPHRAWRRLVASELRSEGGAGRYQHPAGHRALREAIARHVAIARGVDASPDDVTITCGAQQAIDVAARVMLNPGDCVAVEDPGYQPPRRLFESIGAKVLGVPVDADGLVVDALPRGIRLIYVTPSHQYPLGVPMTLPRRIALLAWAERNNVAVIEDDYDSEFRFSQRPIEPLQILDTAGRVIYVGSFSKTLLPTLRLGFLISPPALSEAVHRAKYVTDWHTSMLAQAVLARFIDEGGFAHHILRMSRVYRMRHDLIMESLGRLFSDHLEVIPSTTGLHVAAFAKNASVERIHEVIRKAADVGVGVHGLAMCAITNPPRSGIAIGYGAIPTGQINDGLRRLRRCFDA